MYCLECLAIFPKLDLGDLALNEAGMGLASITHLSFLILALHTHHYML